MIGMLRGGRLLAPVLFGTLLSGGCQSSGTDSRPITPPGAFDKSKVKANEKPAAGPFADRKDDTGFRPKQETEVRDVSAPDAGSKGTEAKNVTYIPPGPSTADHTPSVPSGPDNPLGLFAMRLAAGNGNVRSCAR